MLDSVEDSAEQPIMVNQQPDSPIQARDPQGTLPPVERPSQRAGGRADERRHCGCDSALCDGGGYLAWERRLEEKGDRCDVGSDVPGGGAA